MAISYIICLTRDGKIARDGIFKEAADWLKRSLPDMDISYGNHTEYKTPTIAGQLVLLGAPWVWDPAQHRVLSYPPGIDFTSKRETQLLVVIEANRVHCELIRVAPLVLETLGSCFRALVGSV